MSAADEPGVTLFARYAHAPNALGYCGPSSGLGTTPADIRAAARRFSGAWPYLQVLARLLGVADPLDARLVEAYWLGRDLGVDRTAFGRELLAVIGPQAGHYWGHLTPELLADGAPDHGFHVFGVYPWTRLLGHGDGAAALRVLDSCRIRWGTVVAAGAVGIDVAVAHLTWDGAELGLGEPVVERVAAAAAPGDVVALHWDRFCDRLDGEQLADLARSTRRELAATNARLATMSRV